MITNGLTIQHVHCQSSDIGQSSTNKLLKELLIIYYVQQVSVGDH